MRFRFGAVSNLADRELHTPICRFSYVASNDSDGEEEYILVFPEQIPGPEQEPSLYEGAVVEDIDEGERHLRWEEMDLSVMLLTLEADNKFREESPEVVANNEYLRLDLE